MLQTMQPQLTNRELSPESFAGLLSALTASKAQPSPPMSPESWTDNLKDDVATLSYDQALNNARYRGSESPASDEQTVRHHASSGEDESFRPDSLSPMQPNESHRRQSKKTASVTIRLSEKELAQLQQRALEANLSVSAYLRSCTFEVETLRSQVKQALTELRHQPATAQQHEPVGRRWLRLLRPHKTRS